MKKMIALLLILCIGFSLCAGCRKMDDKNKYPDRPETSSGTNTDPIHPSETSPGASSPAGTEHGTGSEPGTTSETFPESMHWTAHFSVHHKTASTVLSEQDSRTVTRLLNASLWEEDVCDCPSHVRLESSEGFTLHYTFSGVINDLERHRHKHLSGESFMILDALLKTYGVPNFLYETDPEESMPDPTSAGVRSPVAFLARYVRTNWIWGSGSPPYDPVITAINSRQELEAYYSANRLKYDLERKSDGSFGNPAGFLDICDAFDDSFFKTKQLMLVTLQETSGSIRHEIVSVTQISGSWEIAVKRKIPEGFLTMDMAVWHILIAIDRTEAVNSSAVYIYFIPS